MTFLIKDWKKITLTSYTAWAFYTLAILTIAPDVLYAVFELDTNPVVWSVLQLISVFGGIVGRSILQPLTNRWRRRAIVAGIIGLVCLLSFPALASPAARDDNLKFEDAAFDLISKWEGKRNSSYRDLVGVWTICYGHTRTAAPAQFKTDWECKRLLETEILEYRRRLHIYFTAPTKAERLTIWRDVAYTSLAFNVGVRAAGKSTATRRLNAGNIIGGCNALTWWNKAGGRVVRGLVRRRSVERQYCLRGAV